MEGLLAWKLFGSDPGEQISCAAAGWPVPRPAAVMTPLYCRLLSTHSCKTCRGSTARKHHERPHSVPTSDYHFFLLYMQVRRGSPPSSANPFKKSTVQTRRRPSAGVRHSCSFGEDQSQSTERDERGSRYLNDLLAAASMSMPSFLSGASISSTSLSMR